MTLTRSTRADVEAYALPLAGRSRDRLPVPWTASAVMDDCAAFCSHVLWGGKPGPILWVDGFKSAGDGTYAAGHADLAPWDVLLFDWEGNGVGNHVEFMVGDLGNGYVRTYGANGSDSREARYRTRPTHYILGRFRPAWTSAGAPIAHAVTRPTTTPVGDIMTSKLVPLDNGRKGRTVALYNDESMRCIVGLNDASISFHEATGVKWATKDLQARAILNGYDRVNGRGAS
jgi:hypothetical protein